MDRFLADIREKDTLWTAIFADIRDEEYAMDHTDTKGKALLGYSRVA